MVIDLTISADGLDNLPEIRQVVEAIAPVLHEEIDFPDSRFFWQTHFDDVNRLQLKLLITDNQLGQAEQFFYPGELRDTPGLRYKLRSIVKPTLLQTRHYRRQLQWILESTSDWIRSERPDWSCERFSVNLEEKDIGSYECLSLLVRSATNFARFEPVGCLVLGAEGRLDIFDKEERYVFVLRGETWYLEVSHPQYSESIYSSLVDWGQYLDSILQ